MKKNRMHYFGVPKQSKTFKRDKGGATKSALKFKFDLNANLGGNTSSTVRTAATRSAQRWRPRYSDVIDVHSKQTNCQILV